MFIVCVWFSVDVQHVEAFHAAMLRQAENSLHQEPGCLQFDVCQAHGNPQEIFLYEIYTTQTAFDEHLVSAHFLQFNEETVTAKNIDVLGH